MKKLSALVIALIMSLSLCACGGNASSNNETSNNESDLTSQASEIEYFSEYKVPKPEGLILDEYTSEDKMYYYYLTTDKEESALIYFDYIKYLEESGITTEVYDEEKQSYYLIIDDELIGMIGFLNSSDNGKNRLAIGFK